MPKKNQVEANVAVVEDALHETFFLHAVSEGDQGNPNGMVAGKPQNCAFYLASQPYNAKNTVILFLALLTVWVCNFCVPFASFIHLL